MSLVISGDRVRCANCSTIYNKPPAERVFWIGVPFRVEGMEYCPKCGSNAADSMPSQHTTSSSTEVWKECGNESTEAAISTP